MEVVAKERGSDRPAEAMHWGDPRIWFGSGTAPQKELCAFFENEFSVWAVAQGLMLE